MAAQHVPQGQICRRLETTSCASWVGGYTTDFSGGCDSLTHAVAPGELLSSKPLPLPNVDQGW